MEQVGQNPLSNWEAGFFWWRTISKANCIRFDNTEPIIYPSSRIWSFCNIFAYHIAVLVSGTICFWHYLPLIGPDDLWTMEQIAGNYCGQSNRMLKTRAFENSFEKMGCEMRIVSINQAAVLFLMTVMMAAPVAAQQNVKGVGSLTCQEFFDIFQGESDADKSALAGALFSWVQGYASGKNSENPESDQKDLTTLNPDLVLDEVDRYCSINAGFPIYSIAELLYEGLPSFKAPAVS